MQLKCPLLSVGKGNKTNICMVCSDCAVFCRGKQFSSISKRTISQTANPLMHIKQPFELWILLCILQRLPCAIFKLFAKAVPTLTCLGDSQLKTFVAFKKQQLCFRTAEQVGQTLVSLNYRFSSGFAMKLVQRSHDTCGDIQNGQVFTAFFPPLQPCWPAVIGEVMDPEESPTCAEKLLTLFPALRISWANHRYCISLQTL